MNYFLLFFIFSIYLQEFFDRCCSFEIKNKVNFYFNIMKIIIQ